MNVTLRGCRAPRLLESLRDLPCVKSYNPILKPAHSLGSPSLCDASSHISNNCFPIATTQSKKELKKEIHLEIVKRVETSGVGDQLRWMPEKWDLHKQASYGTYTLMHFDTIKVNIIPTGYETNHDCHYCNVMTLFRAQCFFFPGFECCISATFQNYLSVLAE